MNTSQTKTQFEENKTENDLDSLNILSGKLVYLDLNSNYKSLNKVKECLSLIGAVNIIKLN